MNRVIVSLGSLPVLALDIADGTTRIGRSSKNDIVLPLPEIDDFHAEISSGPQGATIKALGEERLRVNDNTIKEAKLEDWDLILIGGYRLRWQAEASAAESHIATSIPSAQSTQQLDLQLHARAKGMSRLAVVSGIEAGRELPLSGPVLVVGRSPNCDLTLSDEAVSWRHISLEIAADKVYVRDLGSSNGTFLDGTRIESAVASPGSRLRLGKTTLTFTGPPAQEETGLAELVGHGPAMQKIYARIRELSASRVPVLITGETGVGKELVARAIHTVGTRSQGPFVPVNCAAIPREIMEDELFGHVKGAFTGATSDRAGAFERADRGTIFLDEIGELPPELQAKLLRVVEDREVARLGGSSVPSDFRIIAATNHELEQEIESGSFRRDLYYRIAVERVHVPPLKDRPEDIPDLVTAFLRTAEEQWDAPVAAGAGIESSAIEKLKDHPWPGNVRELRNVVLRAVLREPGGVIGSSAVDELLREMAPTQARASGKSLEMVEREAISKALLDSNGQRRAAARRLGIAESTLYEKIKKYDLGDVGLEG